MNAEQLSIDIKLAKSKTKHLRVWKGAMLNPGPVERGDEKPKCEPLDLGIKKLKRQRAALIRAQ